jgi:hypothetical protein
MGQTIGDILPLAVGIAISPIPIIAIILMLITPDARRNGLSFLGGWMGALLLVGLVVLFAASVADVSGSSSASDGAAGLKLVLGIVLLGAAVRQWRGRPHAGEEARLPKWMNALDSFTAGRSLAIAALLSGVNPKNLILNAGACLDIAQSGLSAGEQVVALLVFVFIASVTIIAPLVVFFAMGDRSERVLGGWKVWLGENNATVMAVLFVVFGASLVGKGIAGLS